MISARAWGVLWEATLVGQGFSAQSLSESLCEGRDAIQKALNDLRQAGYIRTYRSNLSGKIYTQSEVTETGYQALKSRFLIQQTLQNSNNSNNNNYASYANSLLNCKPESRSEIVETKKEEVEVGYEFYKPTSSDLDEKADARKKYFKNTIADFEATAEEKRREMKVDRRMLPREAWSVADVGHEFAARIFQHFHIKPWSLTKSRFVPALATARKKHGTNGDIEMRIMDLFFASIEIDKYDDAEHLWKLFIAKFPTFVMQAKHSVHPEEPTLTEDAIAAVSSSRLDKYKDIDV